MRRLHLIVTNLPTPDLLGGRGAFRRSAPALSALLARGRPAVAADGLAAALARAFGLDAGLPIAPYSLALDGLTPGASCWMHADPVCLRFHQDHLVLIGPEHLGLERAEAQALAASLGRHFADDGLVFQVPDPQRWYVRLEREPDITTRPLDAVSGRPVEAYLPVGPEAALWRARMTEAQMLLHEHPVNLAREARGALPVNSLWFWGAGRHTPLPRPPFSFLSTRNPIALALAAASGVAHGAVRGLAELPREENALAVLEFPPGGDAESTLEALLRLERAWFRPALHGLRRGAIGRLRLETTGVTAACCEVSPLDTWRFWRRSAP